MGVTHRWNGERDPSGKWAERFGPPDSLPPRDLTDEDLAGFTPAQHDKLASPAGLRLYEPVEPVEPVNDPPVDPAPVEPDKPAKKAGRNASRDAIA